MKLWVKREALQKKISLQNYFELKPDLYIGIVHFEQGQIWPCSKLEVVYFFERWIEVW